MTKCFCWESRPDWLNFLWCIWPGKESGVERFRRWLQRNIPEKKHQTISGPVILHANLPLIDVLVSSTTTIFCTLGPGCTNSLNDNCVATLESRQQLRDNVPVCVQQRANMLCKFALLLSRQPQSFGEFQSHQPGCARSCRASFFSASREKHEEEKKCQKSDRNINKRINKRIIHNPPVVWVQSFVVPVSNNFFRLLERKNAGGRSSQWVAWTGWLAASENQNIMKAFNNVHFEGECEADAESKVTAEGLTTPAGFDSWFLMLTWADALHLLLAVSGHRRKQKTN